MSCLKRLSPVHPIHPEGITTNDFCSVEEFVGYVLQGGDPVSVYMVSELWKTFPELVNEVWDERMGTLIFQNVDEMADYLSDIASYLAEKRYT